MVGLWKKQLLETAGSSLKKKGRTRRPKPPKGTGRAFQADRPSPGRERVLKKKVQTTVRDRAEAVEPDHPDLSISRQCELLQISRTAYYYQPQESGDDPDLAVLLAILDELREHPFYGYRKIALAVAFLGVTRKQVRRIMKKAGLRAIYPGKRLSLPEKGHPKYPYLLRGKKIWLPNQVWDIGYYVRPAIRRLCVPRDGDRLVLRARSSHGGHPIRLTRSFVSGHSKMRSAAMGFRRSSILTKAASSPPSRLRVS